MYQWMESAACLVHDPEWWFSTVQTELNEAVAICSTCAVQRKCLQYALSTRELHGVWGGMKPKQRVWYLKLHRNVKFSEEACRIKQLLAEY